MVGIDEVGRGCWAGPLLVVAARAITDLSADLNDSKKLTAKQRERLAVHIAHSCILGEGWVSPKEIDKHGLSGALRLGARRALQNLRADKEEPVILDGKYNYLPSTYKNVECIVRADNLVPIVSAASIWAKVRRDAYMKKLSLRHTTYRFDSHVGYGTKKHIEALKLFGPIKSIHRFSYEPIKVFRERAL